MASALDIIEMGYISLLSLHDDAYEQSFLSMIISRRLHLLFPELSAMPP